MDTQIYELDDETFWRYFKAFIDDADRRLDTEDGEHIRKWIDLDTANKIVTLERRLVMDAIKGESKHPKKTKEKGND